MTVILEAPEAHRGIRNSRGVEFCAMVVEYDLFANWKNDFATDCAFAQRIETMVLAVIVVVMVVEVLERFIWFLLRNTRSRVTALDAGWKFYCG